LLSQAELFILHFNTSFYDPALRHSSVQFLNYILSGAFYHSTSIETAPGLFVGADSNELLSLGTMTSMTMGILHHKTAFPKSNSITRPAKAKVQIKTGSTYEALNTTKRTFKRIDRINLHDLRERIYYSWGKSGGILVIMPEQNQSRDRSPSLGSTKTLVGDELNMHSGNLEKHLSSKNNSLSYDCDCYPKEGLSGELCLISDSVTKPNLLKFTIQERASLNGGKIVEKAKVFGNAKNMLNSIRLNNAIQLPINIRRRNLSTDCKNNRETLIFSEHE
jgi:hypothetical protein